MLQPSNLFDTPETVEDMQKRLEALPKADRVLAWTIFGLTWNLCAKLTSEGGEDA